MKNLIARDAHIYTQVDGDADVPFPPQRISKLHCDRVAGKGGPTLLDVQRTNDMRECVKEATRFDLEDLKCRLPRQIMSAGLSATHPPLTAPSQNMSVDAVAARLLEQVATGGGVARMLAPGVAYPNVDMSELTDVSHPHHAHAMALLAALINNARRPQTAVITDPVLFPGAIPSSGTSNSSQFHVAAPKGISHSSNNVPQQSQPTRALPQHANRNAVGPNGFFGANLAAAPGFGRSLPMLHKYVKLNTALCIVPLVFGWQMRTL